MINMNCDDIIQMHDSWLTVNSIVGCTNGCKYCFLQSTCDNLAKPKYKVSATEAIEMLFSSKYYEPTIPICLLPNTDPFLNQNNIDYTKELLRLISIKNISNPIILITKCLIPETFCTYLKELKDSGMNLVVYLSYSGLGKEYEPNINHDDIKLNFQNLALNGIKMIHYYRPLIPANSNANDIEKMLDFVNQYTNVSVISGLKVKPDFIDKIDFWDAVINNKEECINAAGIWPESAYNYFGEDYKHSQRVFQLNKCGLCEILEIPNTAFYKTFECTNCNHCSEEQRKRCALAKRIENIDERLKELLIKIDKYNENIVIEKQDNSILIKNGNLTVGDVSYLTYMLGYKVTIDSKLETDNYFNSVYTNAKNLIVK